jgi:hypothetical protein
MTTMTFRLLFAVLLCAASMAAQPLQYVDRFGFDPPRPGAHESVQILVGGQWPQGVPPHSPQVTVVDGRIDIHFRASKSGPTIVSPWGARLRVGPLEPGAYVVSVHADGERLAQRVLDVQPRPFQVVPVFGAARTDVLLRDVAVPPECPVHDCLQIKFGGVPGEGARLVGEGDILVRTPAHADGLVDVSLSTPIGDNATAPNAFRFGSAVDEGDFDRVLFPVTFDGPGANGSDWTTVITVRNDAPIHVETEPLIWFDASIPTIPIQAPFPPGGRAFFDQLGSQAGRFFYIPRGLEPYFSYSSHIRDRSRTGTNLGTQIPVVRASDTSNRIRLIDVPLDPAFRARLRIYDWDTRPRDVTVRIIEAFREVVHHVDVRLSAAVVTCPTTPCLQPEPAYAALDLSSIPGLSGAGRGDIIIEAETGDARLWGFVSLTNNETQAVTVYTPQHQTP